VGAHPRTAYSKRWSSPQLSGNDLHLLIGMRKLPTSSAEDLLEVIMRRYERFDNRYVKSPA